MAGAGYKDFAAGAVLTADQVDTYLMQQTVMVFASSAARTTALSGVVSAGMVSYLTSTQQTQYYNGTAWVDLGGGGGFDAFMLMGA
jgi:PBP1b-binding outer membrane lipoprotein LpoB